MDNSYNFVITTSRGVKDNSYNSVINTSQVAKGDSYRFIITTSQAPKDDSYKIGITTKEISVPLPRQASNMLLPRLARRTELGEALIWSINGTVFDGGVNGNLTFLLPFFNANCLNYKM